PRVLLEILAVALLLVTKCVISAFGAEGERIRKNLIYRLVVALPLWIFYRLTMLLRASERRRMLIIAGVALVAGAIAAWCAAQYVAGYGTFWTHPKLVFLACVIVLSIDVLVLRMLRPPRGYVPPVSHAVAVTAPSDPVEARFAAECWLRADRVEVR